MSTLYHKLGRLSRGKPEFLESFYWAFITSAPTRPTKQAPTSNRKNVISISFILLYIIGKHNPKPLHNPRKKTIIFRNPAGWGVSEKTPRPFFAFPPKGVVLGMQWLSALADWLQFPARANPNNRDRRRPYTGHSVIP